MEFIELLTVLVAIIFVSKIIAKITRTIDILWYIILGMISTQYVFTIDTGLLDNWATLGVVFIMFYAGWREDLLLFLSDIWRSKWIALISGLGPLVGGILAYQLLNFTIQESIVAGIIFTSSAIPYTVAVLRNLGLENTPAAKSTISSAVADNFLSIVLAVGVLPAYALLATQGAGEVLSFSEIWIDLLQQIGLIIGAFIIFGILGLFILPDARMHMRMNVPNFFQRDGILSRLTYFVYKIRRAPGLYAISRVMANMRVSIPLTLLLIFGLALLAHHLGLHPAIAAYLTGLILHIEMYHETEVDEFTHDDTPINHRNLSVFFYFLQEWVGPVFFIYLGAQLVVDWSQSGYVIILAMIATLIVGLFQFGSAYIAALKTSNLTKHDSFLLGLGTLPSDVVAFVILGIATTSGLIAPESQFIVVVIVTILIMNILTSILMYAYKPNYLKKQAEHEKKLSLPPELQ